MKVMNKKKEKKLTILLRTLTNGYMLELNNEGYMYYNAQSLIEGFCIHVGLKSDRGILHPRRARATGGNDEGGDSELAESYQGRQHREETPGRGDRVEGSYFRTEESHKRAEEGD